MATQVQYDFFRLLYDEEDRIYEQLEARAKLYLSIISLFLAGLILKADDAKKSAVALGLAWWPVALVGVLLSLALLLVVVSMRIQTYEGVADPEELIRGFDKEPPSDEEFLDARIVDLAVATNRNSRINTKTATMLERAGIALAIGVIVLLLTMLLGFNQ